MTSAAVCSKAVVLLFIFFVAPIVCGKSYALLLLSS